MICPRCGRDNGQHQDNLSEVDVLREQCQRDGIRVLAFDCVKLSDAANLMGIAEGTLRNKIYLGEIQPARRTPAGPVLSLQQIAEHFRAEEN